MKATIVESADGPKAEGGYAQAISVSGTSEFMFISGQIPVGRNDGPPAAFEDQARLVWRNIERQLRAGGMSFGNLVKTTTFLSDKKYRDVNSAVRREMLGDHQHALTVVIAEIYDPVWLLEIDAIAAK